MNNFQMYRHIMSLGWTLGWTCVKKEVIWSMNGAQTTEQGDCTKFEGNVPHCCKKTPTVVDLLPDVPYNQQFTNCCKGSVLPAWGQDPQAAISAFQVSVGLTGTSNKTIKLPKIFTLLGPRPGYTCGPAKVVPSTTFITPDRRLKKHSLEKTRIVASLSRLSTTKPSLLAQLVLVDAKTKTTVPSLDHQLQLRDKLHGLEPRRSAPESQQRNTSLWLRLQASRPLRINQRVLEQVFFFYPWYIIRYYLIMLFGHAYADDTGMLYGMKFYNDLLMEAGPFGNVQSEVLLRKDKDTFTFKQGWAFPRKVYFNGDECMLPTPDTYPFLPNSAHQHLFSILTSIAAMLFFLLLSLVIIILSWSTTTVLDEEDFSEDSVQDWYLGITDGEKMVLDKLVRYLQLSMDLLRAIHHIKWHKDALQTLFSKLGELGSQVVEEEENLGIKFGFLTLEDRATLESTLQSYDTEEAILRKMGKLLSILEEGCDFSDEFHFTLTLLSALKLKLTRIEMYGWIVQVLVKWYPKGSFHLWLI
ncbi:hypothetical protein V6N11_059386 [Hibiscus sabdariffa]|uniref:COBRA C-terminal domain-containing protein n=1 Tax=Hibiscus sabdariffa TaxID=183260 RepID=A0ABR2AEA3_9ROSI